MLLTVAFVNGRQFLPRDAIMLGLHTDLGLAYRGTLKLQDWTMTNERVSS